MSTQHTRGPWLIEAENCHTGDIATVHNTADKWVTIYAPHWMETGMGEHEQSANARLIAAAPDLLEALGAAEDLLHRMGMQSSDAYQKIDAAIAKATGGGK